MSDEDYYAFRVPPKKLGRKNWRLRTSSQKVLNVVWHTVESIPDRKPPDDGAEGCAAYFSRTRRAASAHAIVDTDSVIFYLPSRYMAWHCIGANSQSVGIEMATQAAKWEWLLVHARDWALDLLWKNAQVTAGYAIDLGIAPRHVTVSAAKKKATGIFGHGEWDPKRRTDPGPDFPWELATEMVRWIMKGYEGSHVTPIEELSGAESRRLGDKHGLGPIFEPDHSEGKVTPRKVRKAVKAKTKAKAKTGGGSTAATGMSPLERSVRDNIAEIQKLRAEVRELRAEVAELHTAREVPSTGSEQRPSPPAAAPDPSPGPLPLSGPGEDTRYVPGPDDAVGLQHHNPGNIRCPMKTVTKPDGTTEEVPRSAWVGLSDPPRHEFVTSDGTPMDICIFTEARFGIRALAKLLTIYGKRHGLRTIRQITGRWAPAGHGRNDPESYANKVSAWSGLDPDERLTFDSGTLMKLVPAFVRMEQSKCPYSTAEIEEGVGLAL